MARWSPVTHICIRPTDQPKQIKLIIYSTEFKTPNFIVRNNTSSPKTFLNQTNVVYKFNCPCLSENNIIANTYISHTTNTLSRRFPCHPSNVRRYLTTKHNKDTDKLKSPDIKKVLVNKAKIIYKDNNKNRSNNHKNYYIALIP